MQPFMLNWNNSTKKYPDKSCFFVTQDNDAVWNFIKKNAGSDNIYLCGNRKMVDEIRPYGRSIYYSPVPEYCMYTKPIDFNKKKNNLILYNSVYKSEYEKVSSLPFEMVTKRGTYYRHMLHKCKYGLENRKNCIRSIQEALGCGCFCFIHKDTRFFCEGILTDYNHLIFTDNNDVTEFIKADNIDHNKILSEFKNISNDLNNQCKEILNEIIKDKYILDGK